MAGVNKAIILGNLGRDPEVRYMPSGDAVATFPIATTERYKDKDGNTQERTEWHNVTAFGRQAEIAGEYLHKGSQAFVEGRIRTEKYTDKEGVERYSTKIIVDRLTLVGGRRDDEGGGDSRGAQETANQSGRSGGAGSGGRNGGGSSRQAPAPVEDFDDDIPF
jgi:single-strand DNA-binding protein